MSNIKHANSFDFARFSAALLVLYSHAFAIGGEPEPVIAGFCSLGSLGLLIFFSISGYLVSMSWLSDESVVRFALRRSLRIFPALTVVILLSTFVLGPLVTTVPMQAYFHHPATYRYLANIWLYVSYYLPGCFEHAPIPNAVNGSLWSLPAEVLMYIILGGLGWISLLKRRIFMVLFCVAVGITALYFQRSTAVMLPFRSSTLAPHPAPILFLGMELHQVMLVAPYFWAGSLFYLYRDRIKLTISFTIIVFMIMLLLAPGDLRTVWSWFAIPYITLAFCTQNVQLFQMPSAVGDLSYGIYIYAFPIQQTIYSYLHGKYSVLQMTALTAGLTLTCAFISWHLIEKPSLRLKPTRQRWSRASAQP